MIFKVHDKLEKILPKLRIIQAKDLYDHGELIVPRVFFVQSFHKNEVEEHHLTEEEAATYDFYRWNDWINKDKLFVKKEFKLQSTKYGLNLPTDLNDL